MDAARFAQPHILSQPVYQPGKPITQVAREFGLDPARIVAGINVVDYAGFVDLAAENKAINAWL